MFRKKKKQPKMTPQEEKRLKEIVLGNKQPQVPQTSIPARPQQTTPQPQTTKKGVETLYFIGKKNVISEKRTVETKSGQIIELPEGSTRTLLKEIYSLTQSDFINILKGVDENKTISKLALKMLSNEL